MFGRNHYPVLAKKRLRTYGIATNEHMAVAAPRGEEQRPVFSLYELNEPIA